MKLFTYKPDKLYNLIMKKELMKMKHKVDFFFLYKLKKKKKCTQEK